jgi:hypothetical protein
MVVSGIAILVRAVTKRCDAPWLTPMLALLELNQKIGTPANDDLRVYPFRRFPYSLVYREDDSGPRIYAFSHQSREPRYWQGRL